MRLIVHAPNVHQGGGRTLLVSLLACGRNADWRLIIDARMDVGDFPSTRIAMRVKPSITGRFAAEVRLRRLASSADRVLCLGNLPPLFALAAPVTLYLQNRNLVGPRDFAGFRAGERVRIALERAWLRERVSRVAEVIVQTPSMARLVERHFGRPARVMPFLPSEMAAASGEPKTFDFIYVASAEPHKNHRTLIEAWRLLARDGLRPSLCLVLGVNSADALIAWIEEQVGSGLDIRVYRSLPRREVLALYARSKALIFPSAFESLGLPLLEAAAAGLPILAAELDYVRDVVRPSETFDPHSPVSIARAVKRHLGVEEGVVAPVSAERLLQELERPAQEARLAGTVAPVSKR